MQENFIEMCQAVIEGKKLEYRNPLDFENEWYTESTTGDETIREMLNYPDVIWRVKKEPKILSGKVYAYKTGDIYGFGCAEPEEYEYIADSPYFVSWVMDLKFELPENSD